jgi:plasmid maintenance system killer protein
LITAKSTLSGAARRPLAHGERLSRRRRRSALSGKSKRRNLRPQYQFIRGMSVNQARVLQDMRVPPGNRLEALKGSRKGQHSIRINDQWHICFEWQDGGPGNVQIVDYHD